MRLYENVFIGRQDLSQPQVEGICENITNIIKKGNGEVARAEYCGLRVCSYPIRKNRKGHYFYMQIKASQEVMKETERYMKLNEEILRFLTVSVDKFDNGPCLLIQQKPDFQPNNELSSKPSGDKGYRPVKTQENTDDTVESSEIEE